MKSIFKPKPQKLVSETFITHYCCPSIK